MADPPLSAAGLALLAICANPDADHRARLGGLVQEDWAELAALASRQRAAPLVYRAVRGMGADSGLPVAFVQNLRSETMATARHALLLRQTLASACRILEQIGIEPVVLKGLRLAQRDYPQPVLRPLRDLDLLVPADRADAAQAALLEAGFAPLVEGASYGTEHNHQMPELVDPETGSLVEIHHRIDASGWAEEPLLVERLVRRSEIIEIDDRLAVRVPSAHDNLLHIVEHGTIHHLFDNGPLVLADLHFAAGAIDWPVLEREADELGLTRALGLMASVARRHGATWMPSGLADDVDEADLQLADRALLRGDADRKHVARLRRLELRTGAPPGLRAAWRAMRNPNPAALAGRKGGSRESRSRPSYAKWLAGRLAAYLAKSPAGVAPGESSRQVALHRWLRDRPGQERADR